MLKQLARQYKMPKRLRRFPRVPAPVGLEREYERAIRAYLVRLQELVRHYIIRRLPEFARDSQWRRPNAKVDAADDILGALSGIKDNLAREYSKTELRRLAIKAGMSVSDYNRKALANGFKTVTGIDILFQEGWLREELDMWAASNANLITNISDQVTDKIQKTMFEGFRVGTRWEEMAQDIENMADPDQGFSRSRARLIARDQVNKLNGQLNMLRQQEIGVERYIWRTMKDERVRPNHETKEGNSYSWDKPPADTGHPGEDIQCRCWAEPDLSPLLEEEE